MPFPIAGVVVYASGSLKQYLSPEGAVRSLMRGPNDLT